MIKIVNDFKITEPIQFAINYLSQELSTYHKSKACKIELNVDPSIKSQGYHRTVQNDTIKICGADEAGIMYGILDLGRDIGHNRGLDHIEEIEVVPYLEKRGIKFNIPLDARTPSYSDASDSAFYNIENMWDFEFWTEFLDRMAMNKYNVLSLWSLSPFPSLVRIPEYPLTALDDVKKSMRPIKADLSGWGMYDDDLEKSLVTVKKITMNEKISFWQSVMDYAAKRCIKIFIFTWNLFVYGTEHSPYNITCDQNNPRTKDYIYCATKALMDTYPLLAGIGVTSGENMLRDDSDIPFIADTYGRGVKDYLKDHANRKFEFIHRMQYTQYDNIMEAFRDFPCPFGISFKYSQAHMYSATKPAFIDTFMQEKAKDQKIWLTIRNDDFYMYRWGNPEFARDYIKNLPVDSMIGYYMGADGYTWGRDYMDLLDQTHPLFLDKMWYMFLIWGELTYNINRTNEFFQKELEHRFGGKAKELYECWKHASEVVPEVNQVHWHDYDFQWYPEGCCMYDFEKDKIVFADINEFIQCPSMPGGNYYSVAEYCERIQKGKPLSKVDPITAAKSILNHADQALGGVCRLRKEPVDGELMRILDDIEALSYLGYYYGTKLQAAVNLCDYRMNHNQELQVKAVEQLKEASFYWARYSTKSSQMYQPQVLTRLCGYVDVQRFNRLAQLDVLLAMEDEITS